MNNTSQPACNYKSSFPTVVGQHNRLFAVIALVLLAFSPTIDLPGLSLGPARCEAGRRGCGPRRATARRRACRPCCCPCCTGDLTPPRLVVPPLAVAPPVDAWHSLFDGQTLDGWKVTDFAGHGEVQAKDNQLILGVGIDLTGVTIAGDFPKINYELSLDAMRVDGSDFFCGLTFPVGDDPCTFIVGGWAGTVVGLSSVDGFDASENETTQFISFDRGRWYHIRLRVTDEKIETWIDDKQIVDFPTKDRQISIRWEVDQSKPLGIAAWQTTSALKNIRYRLLPKEPEAAPGSSPLAE